MLVLGCRQQRDGGLDDLSQSHITLVKGSIAGCATVAIGLSISRSRPRPTCSPHSSLTTLGYGLSITSGGRCARTSRAEHQAQLVSRPRRSSAPPWRGRCSVSEATSWQISSLVVRARLVRCHVVLGSDHEHAHAHEAVEHSPNISMTTDTIDTLTMSWCDTATRTCTHHCCIDTGMCPTYIITGTDTWHRGQTPDLAPATGRVDPVSRRFGREPRCCCRPRTSSSGIRPAFISRPNRRHPAQKPTTDSSSAKSNRIATEGAGPVLVSPKAMLAELPRPW